MRLFKISNKESQHILAIPYCCGSSFFEEYSDWIISQNTAIKNIEKIYIHDWIFRKARFKFTTDLPVVKVLRNPVKRFWSWHNRFVLADQYRNCPNINKENSYCKTVLDNQNYVRWFDEFLKDLYMEDHTNHTAPQSWAHNRIKTSSNTTYISTAELNQFYGILEKDIKFLNYRYAHTYHVPEADNFVMDLYKEDFDLLTEHNSWHETTLEFWQLYKDNETNPAVES